MAAPLARALLLYKPERSLTLLEREHNRPAIRLVGRGSTCVVMACSDMREADEVGRQLTESNSACLVTYFRSQDLLLNSPTGRVALVILATEDSPLVLRTTLAWLRHRLPHCPVTVVANSGCGDYERVAREGGATFLVRPVSSDQWAAVLTSVAQPAPASAGQAVPKRGRWV